MLDDPAVVNDQIAEGGRRHGQHNKNAEHWLARSHRFGHLRREQDVGDSSLLAIKRIPGRRTQPRAPAGCLQASGRGAVLSTGTGSLARRVGRGARASRKRLFHSQNRMSEHTILAEHWLRGRWATRPSRGDSGEPRGNSATSMPMAISRIMAACPYRSGSRNDQSVNSGRRPVAVWNWWSGGN